MTRFTRIRRFWIRSWMHKSANKKTPDGGTMKKIDTRKLLLDEGNLTDEQFEDRNLLNIASVGIFLVGGPLFIYFGFYLLTSPFTVKWGALSIAIGFLVLNFGFSLWQDRQVQTLHRLQKKENAEMRRLLEEFMDGKKN
jgi:hypothetical protein